MKPARLLLVVPLLVTACGGSNMREAAEPSRSDAPAPTTIEEAQDQIAEAQARLGGAPEEKKPAGNPAPSPEPVTPAPPAAESGDAKKKDEPRGGAASPCESPCRAFASMKRAVESLCRMTGETDERCIRARRTLETSSSRVAACLCR